MQEPITEIKAFAVGIHAALPNVRTILDIGGQDTKAILH
jgi:(R)-2-hydroxyacyl-CoA dehydratese activating ATPase